MNRRRVPAAVAAITAGLAAAASFAAPAGAASGPPPAATAFTTALITPAGGTISGFGVTATFAPGAVTSTRLIILGDWPNGLDVAPPGGERAVKTFGLQECAPSGLFCTSEFGNFANSPAGSEKIKGQQVDYTAFQNATAFAKDGNSNFGTPTAKGVTFTIATGADKAYIYNANNTGLAAYPGPGSEPAGTPLPSSSTGGQLTFQTFQPIVWVLTTPAGS